MSKLDSNILEDKVAVVTGGNSGIGLATAQRFAAEGAKVVIFGRDAKSLDSAVASIGDAAIGVQGDVTQMADLDRLYQRVEAEHGRIDTLFVNAGVAQIRPLEEVDEEHFDLLFDINVKGAFFTVQKALPLLSEGASIVLNASIASHTGNPAFSVYSATKAAVRSLARTLSADLLERRIRVNSISPGPIATPIFGRIGVPEEAQDDMARTFTEQVPMKRFGNPEEIASAAVFLASAESSYVLGHDLVVDGGMTQL